MGTALRLALLYAHLLLCAFALQRVLATDWAALRGRLGVAQLDATHRLIVALLAGLWASGLALAACDLGFDPARWQLTPKLQAKLFTVAALSANGVLLRCWCFARLAAGQRLNGWQEFAVVAVGATSTFGWLASAAIGVARSLHAWPLAPWLGLLVLGWAGALAVAALVAARRWRAPLARDRAPPQNRPSPFVASPARGSGAPRSSDLPQGARP